MKLLFSKRKNIISAISSYGNYCIGYPYKGGYIAALLLNIDSFNTTSDNLESEGLDSIVAYDRAETSSAYIGQINMSLVSSFVGPEGLIWGYDVAKNDEILLPEYLSQKVIGHKFNGLTIKNGENLRKAATALFGTNNKRFFPFLPGSHVPCAAKFHFAKGQVYLYATIAIGIPKDRDNNACSLMEDVGEIKKFSNEYFDQIKQKISLGVISSVLEIGKNQNIEFEEIIVDTIIKEIKKGDMGCALVAMPYFHLAKNAYDKNLPDINLKNWIALKQKYFKG